VAAGRRNDTNGTQHRVTPHLTAPSLNGGITTWPSIFYKNRPSKKATVDNKIVEANGSEKWRPNNVKRTSPGKRPTPNFSSQGSNWEKITSARKITNTQRIIFIL
jgi:hypothetical protein